MKQGASALCQAEQGIEQHSKKQLLLDGEAALSLPLEIYLARLISSIKMCALFYLGALLIGLLSKISLV